MSTLPIECDLNDLARIWRISHSITRAMAGMTDDNQDSNIRMMNRLCNQITEYAEAELGADRHYPVTLYPDGTIGMGGKDRPADITDKEAIEIKNFGLW